MHQYLYMLTLLMALCTSSGDTEECPVPGATSFTFSVASHRNLTGHWIVEVDASRQDPKMSQNSPRHITVDVRQKTASCETSENLQLTATGTVSSVATRTPPTGYEIVNGLGYYKMHAVALTWEEARDKCLQEGAHLIVLNSDQEAQVVKTYFDRKPSIPNEANGNFCFVGFHDKDKEGEFVTVLGQPISNSGYTHWGPQEPNGGTIENCGTIYKSLLTLNDYRCHLKLFFICEYSS